MIFLQVYFPPSSPRKGNAVVAWGALTAPLPHTINMIRGPHAQACMWYIFKMWKRRFVCFYFLFFSKLRQQFDNHHLNEWLLNWFVALICPWSQEGQSFNIVYVEENGEFLDLFHNFLLMNKTFTFTCTLHVAHKVWIYFAVTSPWSIFINPYEAYSGHTGGPPISGDWARGRGTFPPLLFQVPQKCLFFYVGQVHLFLCKNFPFPF